MVWRRAFIIGWLSTVLMACGAPVPAPETTLPPATVFEPSATPLAVTATPRLVVPPPTIAVAVVPTLPPIIVTNPLPSATPWPTATEDAVYVMTLTAIAAVPRTPTPEPPDCPLPPTPAPEITAAAIQHFETGLMFWLQSRNEIWVLIASPTPNQFYWRTLPNQWSDGIAESDPNLKPPTGRYQPVRGFGYAWRIGSSSTDAQRPDLGWALDEEVGFTASLIYYPQGYLSLDCVWQSKSGIYELRDNRGTVYQFVGEGGVANLVNP